MDVIPSVTKVRVSTRTASTLREIGRKIEAESDDDEIRHLTAVGAAVAANAYCRNREEFEKQGDDQYQFVGCVDESEDTDDDEDDVDKMTFTLGDGPPSEDADDGGGEDGE